MKKIIGTLLVSRAIALVVAMFGVYPAVYGVTAQTLNSKPAQDHSTHDH